MEGYSVMEQANESLPEVDVDDDNEINFLCTRLCIPLNSSGF
jgi:hypothetical protein